MSGRWATSTRRSRLPADWAARRTRVLDRDRRTCHVCGGPGADAVDHLVPGDNHDETNLAAIHQDVAPYCHRTKTQAEAQSARVPLRRPAEPHPALRR